LLGLPIYFSIDLLSTKFAAVLANPTDLMMKTKVVEQRFADFSGIHLLSDENLMVIQKKATTIIPTLINSSAILLSNFAIMFFLLYYFLKSGRELEIFLFRHIPLKPHNLQLLGHETLGMVRANAIGIPVLAITQGLIAALGYWIFDVNDFVLWGFLTGIFSMVPVVGTAIIWIPIVAYMVAVDQNSQAIGLLIYALVLITHIDYVVRLTLLKKYMDVHPLITIFGVIIGIGLFGFWGVIFGPLLISYFLILVKIYMNEFYIDPNQS
jgi:predicted PurR-regulated permease PerM